MNFITNFLSKCFSTDGAVSFGRVATAFLIAFCVGWDTASLTFLFLHWTQLHVTVSDLWVPGGVLAGQIAFFSAPYSLTKLKDGIDSYRSNSPGTPGQS